MALLIKGGTVVLPDNLGPFDIIIDEGKIVATGYDLDFSPKDEVIDASGLIVLPGFIDIHTHLDLSIGKYTSADDFISGSISALAGGTTTIVDYISPEKGETAENAISRWKEKASGTLVDFSFHLTLLDSSEQSIKGMELAAKNGIMGFKVFLAYPDRLMMTPEQIKTVMKKVKELGGVLFVHTEDGVLIESLREKSIDEGKNAPYNHALTRPSYSEGEASKVIYNLVKETGCPTVIVHISAKEVLDSLKAASMENLPLFGETCPQYLWLNDRHLQKEWPDSACFVCSPPIRDISHLNGLWDGLIAGNIHFIATDHCPFTIKERISVEDDFTKIPNGLAGLETRFSLIQNGGVENKRFGWVKLARLLATNPSIITGLFPRKGAIIPGSDADLVLFDPNGATSLSSEDLSSKCDHSPYGDMYVKGNIAGVFKKGELVVNGGVFAPNISKGEFIKRTKITEEKLNYLKMEDYKWVYCH
jgi:dihydropyrimidinase